MGSRIKLRRATAAQWAAANPILADGEIGYESDTSRIKIGNGVTVWGNLNYYFASRRSDKIIALAINSNSGDLAFETGFMARKYNLWLKCKVAVNGYTVGDYAKCFANEPVVVLNQTGIGLGVTARVVQSNVLPTVLPKAGGAPVATNATNWEIAARFEEGY